jgi:hypothetical protein
MTTKKTKWKAPAGHVMHRHEGTYINNRGFGIKDNNPPPNRPLMPDGTIDVLWFDEDEPFVWKANDGMGPNASEHAKDMARAGTPLEGWHCNVTSKPIKDGWMPPVYTLHLKEEAP